MKEIFTISTGATVAKVKPTSKNTGTKETNTQDDKKTSTKDFLSIMFAHIKKNIETSKEDSKLSLKIEDEKKDIKIDLDGKNDKKSLDTHLLEDLLKVVSLLKNLDTKDKSFPSLPSSIEKLINNETALKELENVNNINDLVKLSKKYDLGLEKISIKKIDLDTMKKDFPILEKKDFFKIAKEEIHQKVLLTPQKEEIPKPIVLSINNIDRPKTDTKKEPTLFEKIMSSPKENSKETNTKETNVQISEKIQKEQTKVKVTENIKIPENIKSKINSEENQPIVLKEEEKELKIKIDKEALHVKDKAEAEAEKPKHTKVSDVKIEQNLPKKGLIDDIIQNIKANKQKPTNLSTTNIENIKSDNNKQETHEIKTEPIPNRQDIKSQIKTDTLASKQLNPSKNTFNNFVADFKEKIETYKPPIMKVQLALTPKGLGEVDVTIINRGNNLHVNISSNTNTMSLFTQNQAEFKNSLVNMGFTNLEMNFSNQKENKDQQNSKSSKDSSDFFEDDNLEDETTSLELIVPKYV